MEYFDGAHEKLDKTFKVQRTTIMLFRVMVVFSFCHSGDPTVKIYEKGEASYVRR